MLNGYNGDGEDRIWAEVIIEAKNEKIREFGNGNTRKHSKKIVQKKESKNIQYKRNSHT